jgi:arylmalonate decarboxylase
MRKHLRIGLVVPFSTDRVPDEGLKMYPDVTFIPKGVGVRALTPEGYDAAWDGILPAAKELAKQGVDAIMVIGTSLTFYRGYEAHQNLLEQLRKETGLPVSTMSEAVVDGLRSVGAKKVAVATAYSDLVNDRLAEFLKRAGFEVAAMKGFGILEFGGAEKMGESDIIDLSGKAIGEAKAADAVLISCGGLMTLGLRVGSWSCRFCAKA